MRRVCCLGVKRFLERLFDAFHFHLTESRQILQTVRRRLGNVRKCTQGGTQRYNIGPVDFVDAGEGVSEERVIILVDALLYQVRRLVFKLLERRDVLTSLLIAPCYDDRK